MSGPPSDAPEAPPNKGNAPSEDRAFTGLPPPWVNLADALNWLGGRFNRSAAGTLVDLVLAVRSGQLDHRVSQWLLRPQRWAFSDLLPSQRRQAVPTWLRFANARDRVCVLNWDDAQFDLSDCSVASWSGHRCLVQVKWAALAKWFHKNDSNADDSVRAEPPLR